MAGNQAAGTRILSAYARLSAQTAADLAAGRAAGLPASEIAELEAQHLAARNRYQELAVELPASARQLNATSAAKERRPWWRTRG
jgi:hypothetical protein